MDDVIKIMPDDHPSRGEHFQRVLGVFLHEFHGMVPVNKNHVDLAVIGRKIKLGRIPKELNDLVT